MPRAGCAAPPWRGHVCARSTGPKPWESILEFRTQQEDAQGELDQEPLHNFAASLPPSVAGEEEVADQVNHFLLCPKQESIVSHESLPRYLLQRSRLPKA